jgi:hypothetical protein
LHAEAEANFLRTTCANIHLRAKRTASLRCGDHMLTRAQQQRSRKRKLLGWLAIDGNLGSALRKDLDFTAWLDIDCARLRTHRWIDSQR